MTPIKEGMPRWSVDCYDLWEEQFHLSVLKTPHSFKIYPKVHVQGWSFEFFVIGKTLKCL